MEHMIKVCQVKKEINIERRPKEGGSSINKKGSHRSIFKHHQTPVLIGKLLV